MLATLKIQPRHPARPAIQPPAGSPELPLKGLLENRHFQPVLVASRPVRVASRSSMSSSILTHFGMGALVIVATLSQPARSSGMASDTTLIFLPPVAVAPPVPRPVSAPVRPPSENPPPKGFQTVAAPVVVSTEIPPVDLEEQPLDPADFTGTGVEGGRADGVVGGTGDADSAGSLNGIYDAATGDSRYTAARIVRQVAPDYPPVLRRARVEGSVTIRFIVDTLGRVEPGSVEVLESSLTDFNQPAIRAMLATRFSPARFDRRAVRQVTNQRISFQLR